MVTQNIICDIYIEKAEAIHFVQGEEGRTIEFSFINSADDPEHDLNLSGKTVTIHILKPDNTFTIEDCTVSGNKASYTLTENDCAAGGVGIYDLSISESGLLLYTMHGEYHGDYAAVENGAITSYSSVLGLVFPDDFQLKLTAGANITIDPDTNVISSTGGGGGTTDYTALTNKPQINNVTLSGNKTLADLGITDTTYTAGTGLDLTGTTFALNNTTQSTLSAVAGKVNTADVGVANGVAELDATGKVPQSQLPSYVDDVVDGYYDDQADKFYEDAAHTIEISGESGKIYIDVSTNLQYRWTGSGFGCLGGALTLGETSSTAYRGDRGKIAYDTSLANQTNICPNTYDPTATYYSGDYVIYNNLLYVCLSDGTTGAWDITKWTQTSIDQIQYDNMQHLETLYNGVSDLYNISYSNWADSITYNPGDYVLYNGVLYRCTATTSGSWDSTKWSATMTGTELTSLNSKIDNGVSVSVTATANETMKALMQRLYNLVDYTKVTRNSAVVYSDGYFYVSQVRSTHMIYTSASLTSSATAITQFLFKNNECSYKQALGSNIIDYSTTPLSAGTTLKLIY